MVMRICLLLLVAFQLFACKGSSSENAEATNFSEKPVGLSLQTAVKDLRLRDVPGEKGQITAVLPIGTDLEDLGEVSDFTTRVNLRGITYDEPWIKVKTPKGQIGWVYGGGLNFNPESSAKTASVLLEKRTLALFGKALTASIQRHRRNFNAIRSVADFSRCLQEGLGLRDTLVAQLQQRIQPGAPGAGPDFFWLGTVFPGFQVQLAAEGTAWYLFCDYRQWLQPAKRTSGIQDDLFMDLQLAAFPEDSIEYFFPAWQIQTWDYGGSSLLGKSVHFDILQKLDAQFNPENPFGPLLLRMKQQVVEDITNAETSFWNPASDAMKELDRILEADFKILDKADRIALSTRREQLNAPQQHGISTNLRAG
jgi:hypothetical protein